MGLISRLTAWIGDLFGGSDGDSSSPDDADASEADAEDRRDGDARLDPAAATETRVSATDDPVDALRDVRKSQEAEKDETTASEPPDETSVESPDATSAESVEPAADEGKNEP
ncbi:hypothetical protein [Halorubrum trueperi]|uniref:Signal recognition particle-docking protein FtsY n=1 Tax=Halorubrum trueperi TaxID=2004704 RepID=A0ABD5UUP2_9EURY